MLTSNVLPIQNALSSRKGRLDFFSRVSQVAVDVGVRDGGTGVGVPVGAAMGVAVGVMVAFGAEVVRVGVDVKAEVAAGVRVVVPVASAETSIRT